MNTLLEQLINEGNKENRQWLVDEFRKRNNEEYLINYNLQKLETSTGYSGVPTIPYNENRYVIPKNIEGLQLYNLGIEQNDSPKIGSTLREIQATLNNITEMIAWSALQKETTRESFLDSQVRRIQEQLDIKIQRIENTIEKGIEENEEFYNGLRRLIDKNEQNSKIDWIATKVQEIENETALIGSVNCHLDGIDNDITENNSRLLQELDKEFRDIKNKL